MPSARREPDAAAGPVEHFAYDLRRLREQAGSPDYRAMARRAGCAHSTLSTAASGRKLPTLEATLAFVRACGADTAEQARWARRWRQARAALDHPRPTDPATSPAPLPAAQAPPPEADGGSEVPVLATPPRRAWRLWRSSAAIAGAAAVAGLGVAALLGFGTHPAARAVGTRPAVLRSPTALPAGRQSTAASVATPEPERRHGPLVLVPGTVVDLDSRTPDWAVRTAPGSGDDDIEFTSSDHVLTGLGNADMAVLPSGDVGTFDQCALEQNYGVQLRASAIRPGVLLCDITTHDRIALLRVTNVQRDADGTPDQVTVDAVVWTRLHKN
ncbi:helix-turn-helix domain-containing protein (plasmid) [Streptomyces sp. NBC_01136]|uniref:helix-turn-helix domain-containing protein n=1 Tax=Streptomyces sp. NBC_01136 TaxID=2903754 RepID=UPI002F90FD38|nr:helix-turn-helix domain-containing protein [Streptomyces sp. NBC_01136]